MIPYVYNNSRNSGQTFKEMFLGTFWSPPQNIPAPIDVSGEMSLENNGFQDNTSNFDKNYPIKTSSWESRNLFSQT